MLRRPALQLSRSAPLFIQRTRTPTASQPFSSTARRASQSSSYKNGVRLFKSVSSDRMIASY